MNKFLPLVLACLMSQNVAAGWVKKSEAGSVIEKLHHFYDVKKDGTSILETEYVLRIQSEDGKANFSKLTVEYNAMTDKVEILQAYTLNGKERIDVPASAIEDRDKGESRDYDVQKVKSVLFPQVKVGSKLLMRYRLETNKAVIKDTWSAVFGYSPGAHVESLRVHVKSAVPLFYELQNPIGALKVRQIGANEILLTNRKDLPGWVHAEKDPFFHPDRSSVLWISTHQKWPDFFQELAKGYEDIIAAEVPKPLRSWIQQAQKLKPADRQILFLMEKISKDFRYFGDWRRHDGGFVPRSLQEIDQSRYGDCKDLSSLLTALLRALKIEAHVALVRRGENPWGFEPDYKLPATARFNHAIVRAKIGDRIIWLDPTNPVTALKPFPDISGRPAYLLKRNGGEFDRLPEPRAKEFRHVHNYQYKFKADGSVAVDVKARMEDLAPYSLATNLMLSSRSEILTEALEYLSEGHEIRQFKFGKEPQTTRVLGDMDVDLEYEAGRVTYNAGKASFIVIPDGFLEGAFYETDQRESDLRLATGPYQFKVQRRLSQTRLAQELPETCRVDSPWMSLERSVQVDGSDVVIHQMVELRRPVIQRAEFRGSTFKKLQEDTKRCFHRSGLLIEPIVR